MTLLDEENSIRRYLLGDLSSADRDVFEEWLFLNPNSSALVDAIEDELIDDFVHDRLESEDRERFERVFLTTNERRERLKFARVFIQGLVEFDDFQVTKPKTSPVALPSVGVWRLLRSQPRLAIGLTSVLLLISIGTVLWLKLNGGRVQVANQPRDTSLSVNSTPQIVSDTSNNERTNVKEVNDNRPSVVGDDKRIKVDKTKRRSARPVFAVALESGLLRGDGGLTKFSVPAQSKTVVLRLRHRNDDDESGAKRFKYEAELQDGELKTIVKSRDLYSRRIGQGDQVIDFHIPATMLAPGNYQVLLRKLGRNAKVENLGGYYFVVSAP